MTLLSAFLLSSLGATPAAPAIEPVPATPSKALHCQVPCGIYGDKLRIDMLREHAATIEKAMRQIEEIGAADEPNWNQLVRWVTTKDEHAQMIQDQVGDYWLAQRIKAPKDRQRAGFFEQFEYSQQLESAHRILTSAMKCKQTTDLAHVRALRTSVNDLVHAYFTDSDRAHLHDHGVELVGANDGEKASGIDEAKRNVAKATITVLHNAILQYRLDNSGRVPDSLEVLVTADVNGLQYIDRNEVPKDPWGHEYVYRIDPDSDEITLMSYGADGKEGGTGADADITIQDIKNGR